MTPATLALSAPTVLLSGAIFAGTAAAVYIGARPLGSYVLRQEQQFDMVLRRTLLLDVRPRVMTILSGGIIALLMLIGAMVSGSVIGALAGLVLGLVAPRAILAYLRQRRRAKLEEQLVGAVQTLASGVRAGLNLVQAIELVAREGPNPLRQEFAHLLREYEYGMALEEAMSNAATRIGSNDFRLLFSALQTHRERGGDLGNTLDRIAESINEIQRLEHRVATLTAQGRANSRFLAGLVFFVLIVLYFIDPQGVKELFVTDLGKVILTGIVVLNAAGFAWIKKIVSIDI